MRKLHSFQSKVEGRILHSKFCVDVFQGLELVETKKFDREFELKEVSNEGVLAMRESLKPGFVLKKDNSYLYTPVPKDFRLISPDFLGYHLCSQCQRLSAAADCDGGCAKVRDLSIDPSIRDPLAIKQAKRIEKYPFITEGYELFSTSHENLVVLQCSQYEDYPKQEAD